MTTGNNGQDDSANRLTNPQQTLRSQGEDALADKKARQVKGFPIVGIGASAGGLAALEAFFSAMPAYNKSGLSYVVVQHLPPDHKSVLSDLVRRYTSMRVYDVEDGMIALPNCVYIKPAHHDMAISKGAFKLLQPAEPRGLRFSIDSFFRSLAKERGERAICIVLSGTGSDGAMGVCAVKEEGGMGMVQEPDSAEYPGMPESAIATGLVDYVLLPSDMPEQLILHVARSIGKWPDTASALSLKGNKTLEKICDYLCSQTGHDFSQYKQNTLIRRIERRMAIHLIDRSEEYLHFLQKHPAEAGDLFRDLLISVTSFFRDPKAFKSLEKQAIPRLFEGRHEGKPVRVWVCGCSTGEEAYSVAMLIAEHLEAINKTFKVQIFATDIDKTAIEQARAGVFPESIARDVAQERLLRFFSREPDGEGYCINKDIREMLVFSEQNVIKDPPFSKMDLICCRNLLIYMNEDLKKKLIPLFHYALNPGGVLFLGTSETAGESSTLFSTLDRRWKIYLREETVVSAARPAVGHIAVAFSQRWARHGTAKEGDRKQGKANLRGLVEETLLAHYAQAGILVNGRGEILHIYGRTGKFLEPASGDADMHIFEMARDGLKRELSTALRKAVLNKDPVTYAGVRVKTNGETITVNLAVRQAIDQAGTAVDDRFLVILEEVKPFPDQAAPPVKEGGQAVTADMDEKFSRLEQELKTKEEYLQTTIEEMETSNEELNAANDELLSANESLQSTNEEMETSREEAQSVNEELATVNAELQAKVADLSRANNDMNNLLAGTGVGTLFLDLKLRISGFTPAVTQVINLIKGDIGRPIGHFMLKLVNYGRLVEDVQEVLGNLSSKEAEVKTKDGSWFLMRIRPYRTLENVVEGAVITFVDISERKRIEGVMEARLRLLDLAHKYSISELLQAMLDEVCAMTGSPIGFFHFVEPDQRTLTLQAWSTRTVREFCTAKGAGHRYDISKAGVWVDCMHERRPVIHNDYGSLPHRKGLPPGHAHLIREMVIPVFRRENIVAIIGVGNRPKEYDQRDVEGITQLADLMWEIIENKRAEEAIIRLHHVGSLFVGESGMHVALEEIVTAAMAITSADMGDIQLIDPESGDLKIMAHRGFDQPWLDFWNSVQKGQGACGAAIEKGERIIVEDVTQSPIFKGAPALDVHLSARVRAVQSTPLLGRTGSVIGILSTHFRTICRPDEKTLRLLDLLARQATDIIESAYAEKELAAGTKINRILFDTTSKGVVYRDRQESVLDANPAAERILGVSLAQMRSSKNTDHFKFVREDGSDFPPESMPHMIALKTGKIEKGVVMGAYSHAKNEMIWLRVDSTPLFRPGEAKPYQVITVFEDITGENSQDRKA